ncbi:HNH endonuclease [Paraburkholderia sabiae]|uniref:HNH endonuclease n=1 Tax=Paraburkholderia sabiae TaxID=273251 RepID=UPI001CC34FD3
MPKIQKRCGALHRCGGCGRNHWYRDDGVPLVNGRSPINSQYAVKNYSAENFPPDLRAKYRRVSGHFSVCQGIPGLTGDYKTDAALANNMAGLSSTPAGFVWHHVEDANTMLLIPQDIHNAMPLTGGAAILR